MTSIRNNSFSMKDISFIQLKLIYFWAYVEAGLAGLLHALHIPITGFVAGGFSIIVNVLLAHYAKGDVRVLLKALGIVLAIKFLLSPFTPATAYVAVAFQGLLAALIFRFFKVNPWSIFVFSVLVMLESALQKPLIAFLIFGKQFLATSLLMLKATLNISSSLANSAFVGLFVIYLLVYLIWAFLIAFWANYLQHRLDSNVLNDKQIEIVNSFSGEKVTQQGSFRQAKLPISIILVTAFMLLIFPFMVYKLTWVYIVRLMLIFALMYFVFPYFIRKHQAFLAKRHQAVVDDIRMQLPLIKRQTSIAWELAKDFVWYKRIRYFIFYSIWLNVFYIHD